MAKIKKWRGGYIRQGKKHPTYVIERWVGGEHFHVSTRCRTKGPAMEHLRRFEANPKAYRPEGTEARSGLTVDDKLVAEFCEYMLNEKRNTRQWVDEVNRYLGHWADDFPGKDIRDFTLADMRAALAKRKSRRHRIEAIKSFCAWLRKEKGLLTTREDPTVDMPVPQARPEKHKRRKVIDEATLIAVVPLLPEATRDVLLLQAVSAWHIEECRRFAATGEILAVPLGVRTAPGKERPIAVLVTPHKSGEPTRTPVLKEEDVALAKRVRARGSFATNRTLIAHCRKACEAAAAEQAKNGVPEEQRFKRFTLGMMRHTILTAAVELGASPAEASEFANHKSLSTTRKFYLDTAVPTVSVPVLRLVKG